MTEGSLREVDFHTYCDKCKHKDAKEEKDPCNECLATPGNEDSRKPVNFTEKET